MFGETEFLKQVHKTVGGQPITAEQFNAQLSAINNALKLHSEDVVLDLCCGNGVITTEMAKTCRTIVGIDFSEPLIRLANIYNRPENTVYYCMSVTDEAVKSISERPFTKVYMYEAFQHFAVDDLPKLLNIVNLISRPNVVFFVGGIPDEDRLWDFYDTEERRKEYIRRKSLNQDPIGTWWKQEKLKEVCKENGFSCDILIQNPILHSAHYRFDACITLQEYNPG